MGAAAEAGAGATGAGAAARLGRCGRLASTRSEKAASPVSRRNCSIFLMRAALAVARRVAFTST